MVIPMRFVLLMTALLAGALALDGSVDAADQTLDPSFGNGGVLVLDSDATVEAEPVISMTTDGFLVAWRCRLDDGKDDFCVSKRAADGSPIANWGADQKGIDSLAVVNFGNNNTVRAVGLDSAGRTLLGGHCVVGTSADLCAARLDSAGALDATFDGDGLARLDPIGSGRKENTFSGAVVGNELIIAGGCTDGTTWDACLLRFNEDGGRATDFSNDGYVANRFGVHQSYVRDLIVHPDGTMTSATHCFPASSSNADICLSHLNADGTPISGFGSGGLVSTDFGAADQTRAVEVLADGTSVVVGSCTSPNGDWDSCFTTIDSAGSVTSSHRIALADDQVMRGSAAAITATGKLMLAATCDEGASTVLCVMRVGLDGSLDTTFDGDGVMMLDPTTDNELASYSLELTDNGFMVAAYSDGVNDAAIVVKVLDPTLVPPTTTTTTSTTTTTTTTSSTVPQPVVTSSSSTTSTSTTTTTSSTTTTTTTTEPMAATLSAPEIPVGVSLALSGGRPVEVATETRVVDDAKIIELDAAGTTSTFSLPTHRGRESGIAAGGRGQVEATGFEPRTAISIDLTALADGETETLAEVMSDDLGTAATEFEIPATTNDGNYVLRLQGRSIAGSQLEVSVGIAVAATAIVEQLPSTGGTGFTTWSVLIVALGGLVALVRRQPTG